MTRLLLLLLLITPAACTGPALLNAVARNPDRATATVHDVGYGEGERQVYDLYVPDRPGPHPVLVFFHGGSWKAGSKDSYAFAGKRFAAEGFLTAVPSYTLTPEGAYPVFMRDAAAALADVIERAQDHEGDPDRLFLAGHSAGAYIAVQLALAPEFLAGEGLTPGIVDAVAGLSGPYDFLPLEAGVGLDAFGNADDREATQPVNRVTPEAPPMILITGTDDDTVLPRNTAALAGRLREAGVEVEARRYPGIDHAGTVIALAFPGRAPVVEDVSAFFAKTGSDL
ncbi:alpha/beta hydrolase [Parvularcula oceani]|uniref:alpha/beta hydrolase n=1 Tax=Parvularcula oceani TaxID=1247963 RepID=UPI0004E22FDD|nr:alpha/beta hydrolase [Parvularcula oceani]